MAKVKVPKKVAGVKIPKKVRKRAKKALKLADSPVVREAAVAALGAVGAARAASEKRRSANGHGPRSAGRGIDGEMLVDVIREAALDGVRRFLEGFEEGLRKASEAAGEAAEAVDEKGGYGSRGGNRGSRRDSDEA